MRLTTIKCAWKSRNRRLQKGKKGLLRRENLSLPPHQTLCYNVPHINYETDTPLPPGKELSVRLPVIRPLETESAGAVFAEEDVGKTTWKGEAI